VQHFIYAPLKLWQIADSSRGLRWAWAIIENLYATFWGDVYWTNDLLPVYESGDNCG